VYILKKGRVVFQIIQVVKREEFIETRLHKLENMTQRDNYQ